MAWNVHKVANPKLKNPVLIEGLPGMGNVGKIAVDFLIDSLGAEKLMEFSSHDLPHCVFVNDNNLVELPSIDVYYKQLKGKTLLLLSGDIQPTSEASCYEFCHKILDTFEKDVFKEIITLGGVGLGKIPQSPQVYCTGNSKSLIKKYKAGMVNTNVQSFVGPIVGVSGLLTGIAGQRNIPAVALLAETFYHPNYVGLNGAKELLNVLKKQLKLNVDTKELSEDISELQQELKKKSGMVNDVLKQVGDADAKMDYIG